MSTELSNKEFVVGDIFGGKLALCCDFNRDGALKVLTAAEAGNPPIRSVLVLDASSGDMIVAIPGPEVAEGFGSVVSDLGDADGDGNADYVTYGYRGKNWLDRTGSAYILSPARGMIIREIDAEAYGSVIVGCVSALRDIDADGKEDLAIGVRIPTAAGVMDEELHTTRHGASLVVASGGSGAVLQRVDDLHWHWNRGLPMTIVRRRDRQQEYVLVSSFSDKMGDGRIVVIDPMTGKALASLSDGLGQYESDEITNIGDIDSDGVDDVALHGQTAEGTIAVMELEIVRSGGFAWSPQTLDNR